MEGVPTHGRGAGTRPLGSLPTQTILQSDFLFVHFHQ